MSVSDDINFSKLEREFHSSKDAQAKYSRENDAKFRAVHQKVASYEEFRDIVAASHLNPLERKDIYSTEKRSQPWNMLSAKPAADTSCSSDVLPPKLEEDIACIDTSAKLIKKWKSLKTDEAKREFLFHAALSDLERVLADDIPMNFVEDVVKVFRGCDVIDANHVTRVCDVMQVFTKSKRFSLTLQFLGKGDKENLRELFRVMEEEHQVDVGELKQAFTIS